MNVIKKAASLLLCGVMLVLACAGAAAELEVILKINGRTIILQNEPAVYEDVAYLPLREMSERYGAELEWQEEFLNVVVKTETVTATIKPGSSVWYVGQEERVAEAPAMLTDGVTYLPCDMFDGIFGFHTEYDPVMRIISLDTRVLNEDGEADHLEIAAVEDTYVQNGASSSLNFGSETSMVFKATNEENYGRVAYVKLDISSVDRSFLKAYFRIYAFSGESGEVTVNLYELDPESWSEMDITYDTQPQKGSEIASIGTTFGSYISFDITDYVREKTDAGEGQISFALDGDYYQPLRLDFYSRENETLVPCLYLTYTEEEEESSIITEFPTQEGFGKGEDPVLWAKKMVSESTATGETVQDMGSYQINSETQIELAAEETGFIRYGIYAGDSHEDSAVIECKNDPTSNNRRVAFLRFNIKDIVNEKPKLAYLDVYCENMSETKLDYIMAYRTTDSFFDADTLAWYNAPIWGEAVDKCTLVGTGRWVRLNVTELIDERALESGILNIALQETENVRVQFSGKDSANPPRLVIDNDEDATLVRDNLSMHNSYVDVKSSPSSSTWTRRATVLLENLDGYSITQDDPELDQYGGIIGDEQYEATGFFRTEKIDGRWWIITPEGNRFISVGLNGVSPGTSEGELDPIYSQYGSIDNWAQGTTDWLRTDLGFNTAGGFSRPQYLKSAENQLCYTPVIYFITRYAELMGETSAQAGHAGFSNNNAMPVFDPDWVDFCDSFAESETAEWKDSPYILGWISDNELPVDDDMLERYLTLDYTNPINAYSYATAWEWFRTKTGKEDPTMLDVTDELRDEWREFVYDRYYSVVSAALKKHDPNHMYLGSRYMGRGYRSAGMLRAAGRYCDVVTVNYYNAWTPDAILMNNWLEWSGKPVIITEWYAKGEDSGMLNTSGAGWLVKTQNDRGKFYQNFAISLMMSKSCVGFHWFQYRDNDVASQINDASNTDSNKGIVDLNLNPYTGLINDVAKINKRIYGIIDYIDETF